jgi:hypothetical protein
MENQYDTVYIGKRTTNVHDKKEINKALRSGGDVIVEKKSTWDLLERGSI